MVRAKKVDINPDLLESAENYLRAHAYFCVFDNSDSMQDEESWETTFNFVKRNDPVFKNMKINKFIETHMQDKIKVVQKEIEQQRYEEKPIDWEHSKGLPSIFLGRK